MSAQHPIISITGSSGAGTTSVKAIFELIFRRENVVAAYIEGDAFHRYDRAAMKARIAEEEAKGNGEFSHFNPEANELDILAEVFEEYGRTGRGRTRTYMHDDQEAELFGQPPGTFSPWREFEPSDLLFYEGLHGCAVTETANLSKPADLKIGVVPVINLEWIQKIHRDRASRGYSTEAVMDTILRRMPDYINYICPQFSQTHVNFQRVPLVDTSNPFVPQPVPTAEESLVVIHVQAHSRLAIDFDDLLSGIPDAFLSRNDTLVVRGEHMDLAMELTLQPTLARLLSSAK